MMKKIICTFFSLAMLLGSLELFGQEEEKEYKKDRFSASFGGFYTGLNSNLVVGIDQLGLGLSLGLEDALGLESSVLVLRGDLKYSFGKRRNKLLTAGYIGLLRKASRTLGREIEIDGIVFPLESTIETKFNLEIYKLTYNWGFFQDERMRLGVGGGLFIMPIGFSISSEMQESDFFQFIAPLPSFGLTTDFYIGPRWTFSQSLDLFYIQFGSFEGALTDLNLKLEYQALKHFAFGAGINTFKLNVETKDDLFLDWDFKGTVDLSYTGFLFYTRYLLKYKD